MTTAPEVLNEATIAGLPLFADGFDSAVRLIAEDAARPRAGAPPHLISATDAHGIVQSRRNRRFAEAIASFFLRLPDGMPSVWVGRLKGARAMQRCYGPSVFGAVMKRTADTGVRHFLCGGKPGVAEDLRQAVGDKFGNRGVVGTYSPPFRPMSTEEWDDLVRLIEASGADIVWVGLSSPKQEFFACELGKRVKTNCIITIGAAYDFHTGRVREAPKFIQTSGLEWLFRLLMEPRRLYKRYVVVVPAFALFATFDLIAFYFGKLKYGYRGDHPGLSPSR